MSSFNGHPRITRRAVNELIAECSAHPVAGNKFMQLPAKAQQVDINASITLGHWNNWNQKYHFMRRFDGQSPFEAYVEGVEWIRINALKAAKILWSTMDNITGNETRLQPILTKAGSCNVVSLPLNRNSDKRVVGDAIFIENWITIGYAIHCLQDSFALGHATREKPVNEFTPGAINHVKVYAGLEVKDHSLHDESYRDKTTLEFTLDGRLAINGTKQLIVMIMNTAIQALGKSSPTTLYSWDRYRSVWLVSSPKLSKKRDFTIDFISRFAINWGWASSNIKTINMDEQGMADAMVKEINTDMNVLYNVFSLLDESYNSDADDIVNYYLEQVKKTNVSIENSLMKHQKLVNLLIKILDEGWTTSGEKDNINYLKGGIKMDNVVGGN